MTKIPMTRVAAILEILPRLRRIEAGSLDGEPATILDSRVHATPEGIRLSVTFELGGTRRQVEAEHGWSGPRDVIRVDGADVEKIAADLDLEPESGGAGAEAEYRLEYERNGEPHRLVLTARIGP